MSLEKANIIDAIGIDAASGRVVMVIHHSEPWDGSAKQLYQLQEKLNAYLSFALDGEMADTNPDLANRPLALRIDTAAQPDPRTLHLLSHVRQQIAFQDITLDVRLRDAAAPGCGPACECH
jgi:hypothetical protein